MPAAFILDGEPLGELRGTLVVLGDSGFNDDEAMRWLLGDEESLGTSPIEALRAGRKAEVRRVAQALGLLARRASGHRLGELAGAARATSG